MTREQELRLYKETRPLFDEMKSFQDSLLLKDYPTEEDEKKDKELSKKFYDKCEEIIGRPIEWVEYFKYFPSWDD